MHFMVIEHFVNGARPIYERFERDGRLMPDDGLTFVSSYVTADLSRCFQAGRNSVADPSFWTYPKVTLRQSIKLESDISIIVLILQPDDHHSMVVGSTGNFFRWVITRC